MNDAECQIHKDENCLLCDFYVLRVTTWQGRSSEIRLWVGQEAGMSWGPMGMEDEVSLVYVKGHNK